MPITAHSIASRKIKRSNSIGLWLRSMTWAVTLCLLAVQASAGCAGTDLRTTLNANQMRELDAAMAELPYATGNHWIARRGGQAIHVIGTFHLNDPRIAEHVANLEGAISSADILFVEATIADGEAMEDALKKSPERLLITSGPTLADMMAEESWQRLADYARGNGFPPWMVSKMRPWFAMVTLSLPPCLLQGGKDLIKDGVDRQIEQLAQAHGVPAQSLEPTDTLERLFEALPIKDQLAVLDVMSAGPGNAEDSIKTAAEAYFDQRSSEALLVGRLEGVSEMPDEKYEAAWAVFERVLAIERNLAWVALLLERDEPNITVAVGAAHLPGEEGVLMLLEQAGFSMEKAKF